MEKPDPLDSPSQDESYSYKEHRRRKAEEVKAAKEKAKEKKAEELGITVEELGERAQWGLARQDAFRGNPTLEKISASKLAQMCPYDGRLVVEDEEFILMMESISSGETLDTLCEKLGIDAYMFRRDVVTQGRLTAYKRACGIREEMYKERIFTVLSKMAFTGLGDVLDLESGRFRRGVDSWQLGAVSSVVFKEGTLSSVKMYDRFKAMNLLSQVLDKGKKKEEGFLKEMFEEVSRMEALKKERAQKAEAEAEFAEESVKESAEKDNIDG